SGVTVTRWARGPGSVEVSVGRPGGASWVGCDYADSTGIQISHVAVVSVSSRYLRIVGPGRSRHGLEGNQSVAVAAHVSCSASGKGPLEWKTAHVPASTGMEWRSSGTAEPALRATPWR